MSLRQVVADLSEHRGIRYPQTFTERVGPLRRAKLKIQHDDHHTKRDTI